MHDPSVQLTAAQRQRLRRELRDAREARVYRRLFAILRIDRGESVAGVARSLGVARRTVHYWVADYSRDHDPAALYDAARSGRPSSWTGPARALLGELLATSPQRRGYRAVNWTVPLLREELLRGTGTRLSDETIRRELHRRGEAWKRPRYVLEPDPEAEKKTPHPAANPGARPALGRAGGGRDRPAAVPTAAGRLVAARSAGGRADLGPERPAGGVRVAELVDGPPAVPGPGAPAGG